MSLGLTVVTHTDVTLNRDISRCLKSVQDALPKGAEHLVIESDGDYSKFVKLRQDAMLLNDIVIFVDDDDYILPDSLQNCVDALSNTDVGIAFTKEAKVFDNRCEINKAPTNVSSIISSPTIVHHMTAYRTKYITNRSTELIKKLKISPEWILKVDAALNAGAVHIPKVGYCWVQGQVQNHKSYDYRKTFSKTLFKMHDEFRSWISVNYQIQIWNPPGCL